MNKREITERIIGKTKALQCSDSCHADEIDREIDKLFEKLDEVWMNREKPACKVICVS